MSALNIAVEVMGITINKREKEDEMITFPFLSLRRERKDNHSSTTLSFNYLLRVHQ